MSYWDDVTADDLAGDDTLSLMAGIIGLDATKKIVEVFGGDSVYIPKAESVIRAARDRSIVNRHRQGMSYHDLAALYNLTPSHIRVIINSARQARINKTQMELF